MRIHTLQHVPFEGLGSIEAWATRAGHVVDRTRLYDGEALPDPETFDWLIAMGGPMSVGDEERYPWLSAEKRLIRQAIEADRRVLGICLGAQLMAAALGAEVAPGPHLEIGWFPVERVRSPGQPAFADALPDGLAVFHWHGDRFEIPADAHLLTRSEACDHQAFALGDRVLGLQFHLETTPASARALIRECSDELVEAPYVQSAETMLAAEERFGQINAAMEALLDRFSEAP